MDLVVDLVVPLLLWWLVLAAVFFWCRRYNPWWTDVGLTGFLAVLLITTGFVMQFQSTAVGHTTDTSAPVRSSDGQ